jgi:hypothetical protein
MVQPNYSPEEALHRIKLMMEYDSSKTLDENKKTISEQYVAPAAVAAGTGAGVGAGLAANTALLGTAAAGTAAGTGAVGAITGALGVSAAAAGAIVGGAASLAVLPLVYWLVTKDTGRNKVKKMFEMCSTDSAKIAKLPRKMNDMAFRDMSDNIEDAINDTTLGIKVGTDEEKLFAQFKKLQDGTASDFCAFVKYYNSHSDSGDLFDDLDSDIDAEDEWKQIYRPIRNCVEDSLLTLKDDGKKVGGDGGKSGGKKSGGGYKPCSGTYSYGCKSEAISKVQACIGGLTPDGKFGPKTKKALAAKGVTSFTNADITKICTTTTTTKVEDPLLNVPDDFSELQTKVNTGKPQDNTGPIDGYSLI